MLDRRETRIGSALMQRIKMWVEGHHWPVMLGLAILIVILLAVAIAS